MDSSKSQTLRSGVGPENVSASASTFSGDTYYLGEMTNLIKPK